MAQAGSVASGRATSRTPKRAVAGVGTSRVADLSAAEVLALRMSSLLLRSPADSGPARSAGPSSVAGVVEWFGAMQAQDLGSVLWSLGARLPGWTQSDVEAALERREAVRTWPMRGTVHLVPARDAHWMLATTGVRALAGAAVRRDRLGLDQETADRAVDLLGQALAGGGRLTRAECLAAVRSAGIDVTGQRGYHLLWYASQRGVTCIAPNRGTEQTFVLLDDWVPQPRRLDGDEALATLAVRYFRSHGPTTVADFAGWTGLTITTARGAVAAAGDALEPVRGDGTPMVLAADGGGGTAPAPVPAGEVRVLPGFDEYVLGYKDRSLLLGDVPSTEIVPGGNGVFQPTVVRAGQIVATWRRAVTTTRVDVAVRPLAGLQPRDRAAVERAFDGYGQFLQRAVSVRWTERSPDGDAAGVGP